ncbi:hypothetical protein Tco_0590448 [Tanacetum coccineum]
MTRSSTKELLTPFKEPEREFPSSRKLLKKLSLDESRSPEFNLFSDLEEYSEEEVAEIVAETIEHGSDLEDANEHSEKVLEIVDLFHIPNITQDQMSHPVIGRNTGSGYQQKDRKPSQNDKTEHGMEKTVQNQGQSPKMPKSESIQKNQQSNRSRN